MSIQQNPDKPGIYNVEFEGIMSFMSIFAEFDGEKWIGIPKEFEDRQMRWYPNNENGDNK